MAQNLNPEIENYISSFEDKLVRAKLNSLYSMLLELVPAESEQKISYGIPTFRFKGRNLVHFGGAKNHVAIYPGARAVAEFKPQITKLKLGSSKGTIQFKLDEELPAELIKAIVQSLLEP